MVGVIPGGPQDREGDPSARSILWIPFPSADAPARNDTLRRHGRPRTWSGDQSRPSRFEELCATRIGITSTGPSVNV
jgi:hypothetical protein